MATANFRVIAFFEIRQGRAKEHTKLREICRLESLAVGSMFLGHRPSAKKNRASCPEFQNPLYSTEFLIYETVDCYSKQQKLAYVHLRNVRGKVPFYKESFIDDGDVNILRVLRILKRNNFDGVVIPDHAPQMSCAAPWHAGMAYALGYIRSALQQMESEGA